MSERRRIIHTKTFGERLADEARRLKEQARRLPVGNDREVLLRKARQAETATHMNEWLTSPGFLSPK